MRKRVALFGTYRAQNGEPADEVHVFENVMIGDMRVTQLLMRNGRVIQIIIKW